MCLQRTKPITGDITTNLDIRKNSDYYFIFSRFVGEENADLEEMNIFNGIKMSVLED